MECICIITFGASDIQLNKHKLLSNPNFTLQDNKLAVNESNNISFDLKPNRNYSDYYVIKQPRIGGEIIFNYFDQFADIIEFPLILPLIKKLQIDNIDIKSLILVYTNQVDAELEYKNNDSIYFAQIFKKYAEKKLELTCEFYNYEICNEVANIDYQYKKIGKDLKSNEFIKFDIDPSDKLFLFAQGGIDQINNALTLQLIKYFGEKVTIWQKKEKSEINQIRFAELFRTDLTFDQIKLLIRKGNYQAAGELLQSIYKEQYKPIKSMLELADNRINGLIKPVLNNYGRKQFNNNIPEIIAKIKSKNLYHASLLRVLNNNKDFAFFVSEYLEIANFHKIANNKNQFLMSFAIFVETIVNYLIEANTSFQIATCGTTQLHTKQEELNADINNNPDIIKYISENFKIKIEGSRLQQVSLPVKLAYIKWLTFVEKIIENQELVELLCQTNGKYCGEKAIGLDDFRNDMAHRGIGITDDKLSKVTDIFDKIYHCIAINEHINSFISLNAEIEKSIDEMVLNN